MQLKQLYYTNTITFYKADVSSVLELPLVSSGISAGFPSPADDFLDLNIDLNRLIVKNPSTTFYGKVRGETMRDAGIHDGDLLVIDKSLEPRDGKIAVCFVDGEFTVKRIKIEKDVVWLVAENKDYKPIKVTKDNELVIWGIVTNVIKSF